MNFPDNLKYSDKHLWVAVDGNVATIGITDHAQSQLGELLYVEMPEIGDAISKDEDFGVAEFQNCIRFNSTYRWRSA